MNTAFGNERLMTRAPAKSVVTVAVGFLAAAAAVWALPDGAPPSAAKAGGATNRPAVAMRAAAAEAPRVDEPAAKPAAAEEQGKGHAKAGCTECGVIEAVQTIETPLKFTGWCDATEIARSRNSGRSYGRDFRADRESLSETVAAAIAASRTSTKDVMTTRHRIVVRMRNGARQVFEESTPRTVYVGDRMVVIAGAARANG